MKSDWISPKTIVGSPATGKYYYPRTEIVDDIWNEIEQGSFILIAAPRRVGKTSIMRDIEANPRENYKVKFESIQAVTSELDFYKTLYKLILNCLNSSKKVAKWLKAYLKTKRITEITATGIKIENTELNFLDEINAIFGELGDNTETIVLLLDELPEVLHQLNKNGKKEEAIAILHQLRTWRQSNFKKLQFVFAGSVGIHYVVKNIEEIDIDQAFINVGKNNQHFADWKNRLKDYMPHADFKFVNEILIHVAHKNSISIQTLYDKAVKYDKTADYMDLISDLEQDGYLVEDAEGSQNYVFISPFLKSYWKRNNPIYHE